MSVERNSIGFRRYEYNDVVGFLKQVAVLLLQVLVEQQDLHPNQNRMFESYVLLSRGVFRLVWTGFSQTGLDVSGQQGYLRSKEEAEEIS
jgi:hypothetical protein